MRAKGVDTGVRARVFCRVREAWGRGWNGGEAAWQQLRRVMSHRGEAPAVVVKSEACIRAGPGPLNTQERHRGST